MNCVAYCNHPRNADKDEVETITDRIKRAAKKHRVEIDSKTVD